MPTMTSTYTASGAADKWIADEWAKRFDRAAQNKAKIYPAITDVGRIGQQMHEPQIDTMTASTIADSIEMTEGLTFTANTETETTYTPNVANINKAVNEPVLKRMQFSPMDPIRFMMESAIATKQDADVASQFVSLTTNVEGAYGGNTTIAIILAAQAKVMAGAKEFAEMGGFLFWYHYLQHDDVMNQNNLVTWTARGKTDSGANTGQVGEAYGIRFIVCGNIQNSGGGFNNCLAVKEAFGIGFNSRPSVKSQARGIGFQLYGWSDYGIATRRQAYACLIKSQNT